MKYIKLLFSLLFLLNCILLFSATEKYRLTYYDDPSTSIVVGWAQNGGTNPMVYYDVVDHGTNWANYAFSHGVDRTTSKKGMDHQFSRLTNLIPNKVYYFVIKDSDGTSARYSFKTIANDPNIPLSIIAGGDSRTNRGARQNANILVSKLRPDFVYFGGDYTELNFNGEWKDWFDDWQLTISSDGRMYPIIAARGNHEWSNTDVYEMFDTPNADVYFAQTFGGNLLRTYTLNSEMAIPGTQTDWLINDLQANYQNVEWKMAQYHKPMRPHVASKAEGNDQYTYWAQAFYDYGVQLVVECDAHTVKSTWPVMPSTGANAEEGFKQTEIGGTVYIGEGCWGAPLRNADDNKNWTRNSGVFNSFQWLKITKQKIEIKYIKTDNASSVGTVVDNNRFLEPANLDVWSPSNGKIVVIENEKYIQRPYVAITFPINQSGYSSPQNVSIEADAIDTNGSIQRVEFFINDVLIGVDSTYPYQINWSMPANGDYVLTAWAIDNDGYKNISKNTHVYVGTINITSTINSSSDDAEENLANGSVDITGDLELVEEQNIWPISDKLQLVGLRFNNIKIPSNAQIIQAYIQFKSDNEDNDACSLTIYGEKNSSPNTFNTTNNNISNRNKTIASVVWNPTDWVDGDRTLPQQTPNLKNIIQEVIHLPNWETGNSIAFLIQGSGRRIARSFDQFDADAAELIIQYTVPQFTNIRDNTIPDLTISAYPNPFFNEIKVNWNENLTEIDLKLFNSNGKLVETWKKQEASETILSIRDSLPSGLYFLKVTSSKMEKTIKLLKK